MDTLWNSWDEVPEKHTKWVDQKGGFTNISAYWLIEQLTKKFGPMGIGWKFDYQGRYEIEGALYHVDGIFKFKHGDEWGEFPVSVAVRCRYRDKDGNPRVDDDAPKKAITAAISKASSYLGLANSVYLGEWTKQGHVGGNGGGSGGYPAPAPGAQPAPDPISLGDGMYKCNRCGEFETFVKTSGPNSKRPGAKWIGCNKCEGNAGPFCYYLSDADKYNKPLSGPAAPVVGGEQPPPPDDSSLPF